MYYLSYNYCHNGINCKTCNLLKQCKKGKEKFIMGLWNKLSGDLENQMLGTKCDNCENYQKKEVKEKFEDSFTIYGKKDEIVENKGIKILWYDVYDEKYEICFITKTKEKINISYDRDFWKKISVNIIR